VPSSDIVKELTKKVSTKDFDIKTNLIVFPKRHDVDKGLIGIVDAQIFGMKNFGRYCMINSASLRNCMIEEKANKN